MVFVIDRLVSGTKFNSKYDWVLLYMYTVETGDSSDIHNFVAVL